MSPSSGVLQSASEELRAWIPDDINDLLQLLPIYSGLPQASAKTFLSDFASAQKRPGVNGRGYAIELNHDGIGMGAHLVAVSGKKIVQTNVRGKEERDGGGVARMKP